MKPNSKPLCIVADTEAQTVWNDERLNYYVNVKLKNYQNYLIHRLKYHYSSDLKNKLQQVQRKIADLSDKLCNEMNTYLLGYAEVDPKMTKQQEIIYQHLLKESKKQAHDYWVSQFVNYFVETDPQVSPWSSTLVLCTNSRTRPIKL